MKKTQIGKRMRVYSVGPLSNFFTFFICLLIFSFVFMSAVQPTDGADVFRVYDDTPADEIGLSTKLKIQTSSAELWKQQFQIKL
jgi:hypothetical protein